MQNLRVVVTCLCLGVFLGACAIFRGPAPPPPGWSKQGASYDTFLKDRFACIEQSRLLHGRVTFARGGSSIEIVSRALFGAYMEAGGWTANAQGYQPPKDDRVRMK